jgi:hypothetical protein
VAAQSKGAHTRTSLARESGLARVPMSRIRRVRGATSRVRPSPAGLARALGGARLAIGSYVCEWSRDSLLYPHAQIFFFYSYLTLQSTRHSMSIK